MVLRANELWRFHLNDRLNFCTLILAFVQKVDIAGAAPSTRLSFLLLTRHDVALVFAISSTRAILARLRISRCTTLIIRVAIFWRVRLTCCSKFLNYI